MRQGVHDDRLYLLLVGRYSPTVEAVAEIQSLGEVGEPTFKEKPFRHLPVLVTGPDVVYGQLFPCCGVSTPYSFAEKEGVADVLNRIFYALYEELAVAPYSVVDLVAPDDSRQTLCFFPSFLVFCLLLRLHILTKGLFKVVAAPLADEVLYLCSGMFESAVVEEPLYRYVHLLDDV